MTHYADIDLRAVDFDRSTSGDLHLEQGVRLLVGDAFGSWRDDELLRRSKPNGSFAVVVKIVSETELETLSLDDPDALFDFCVMEGEVDSVRYAANAVRKLRATVRTGKSTLEMQDEGMPFEDVITDEAIAAERQGGPLDWGEFPYAGAAIVRQDGVCYLVGISGFHQKEDHLLAEFLAKFLALRVKLDQE